MAPETYSLAPVRRRPRPDHLERDGKATLADQREVPELLEPLVDPLGPAAPPLVAQHELLDLAR